MQSRYLEYLYGKQHVLFGNNAALIATLACFKKFGVDPEIIRKRQNLVVIIPRFWLTTAPERTFAKDYLWGQKISQLPDDIRKLFSEFGLDSNDTLTWRDYDTFRKRCIKALREDYAANVIPLEGMDPLSLFPSHIQVI